MDISGEPIPNEGRLGGSDVANQNLDGPTPEDSWVGELKTLIDFSEKQRALEEEKMAAFSELLRKRLRKLVADGESIDAICVSLGLPRNYVEILTKTNLVPSFDLRWSGSPRDSLGRRE